MIEETTHGKRHEGNASNSSMRLIRVVDDDAGLREALAFVLEGEGYVIRAYESAEDFLAEDDLRVPGALILDVKMTGMTGLKLQETLRLRGATLPIIFLSAHGTIEMAVDVMQKGAVTFLSKPVGTDKLLEALDRALAAAPVFGEEKVPLQRGRLPVSLPAREREVVRLVAAGLTNRAIAERLGLAKRTVEFFRAGAMRKLDCRNAEALLKRAAALGILEDD